MYRAVCVEEAGRQDGDNAKRNGRDGGRREAATDTAIGRRGKCQWARGDAAGPGVTRSRARAVLKPNKKKRADAGSEQNSRRGAGAEQGACAGAAAVMGREWAAGSRRRGRALVGRAVEGCAAGCQNPRAVEGQLDLLDLLDTRSLRAAADGAHAACGLPMSAHACLHPL